MNTPKVDSKSWNEQHDELRRNFTTGKISKATRKQLEDYLVVLANTRRMGDSEWRADSENFAFVVERLLQVRISEELHWRSMMAAWVSALIAALAVLVAAWQAWDAHKLRLRLALFPRAPISSVPQQPTSLPKP